MPKQVVLRLAVLIVATMLSWSGLGAGASAEGISNLSTSKPKKDRKTSPKVKVAAKKGIAKGYLNMITGQTQAPHTRKKSWNGKNNSEKKLSVKNQELIGALCWEQTRDLGCLPEAGPSGVASLTGPLARAMAVNLVATLRFPAPRPVFGPDPRGNEWGMLAVGFPVWLWTEGDTLVSTSVSSGGFTFRMTARWRSTTFHLGDGASLTCTSMTRYSASVRPGAASPTCGHVYTEPSLPKGKYRVRAVADWDVTWSVAGFSGVLPAYNEASADIPIGELVALNR